MLKVSNFFPPFISLFVLGVGFEILVRYEFINSLLFPSPSQIFHVFLENSDDFKKAFFETLRGVLKGFLLSSTLGVLIAVLFSLSAFLRKSLLPFALFFQTVPIIAIAPLLVIYFGFGEPTVMAATFIVSIFPVLANTLIGLDNVDKNYLDLFKSYKTGPLKTLWKLRLPSAYVSIYSGIKISAGLAVIGAVAGEFVAGGGLGAMIDSARTQQRVDIVFAALILLSVLALFLISFVNLIHLGVQKYRPLARNLH